MVVCSREGQRNRYMNAPWYESLNLSKNSYMWAFKVYEDCHKYISFCKCFLWNTRHFFQNGWKCSHDLGWHQGMQGLGVHVTCYGNSATLYDSNNLSHVFTHLNNAILNMQHFSLYRSLSICLCLSLSVCLCMYTCSYMYMHTHTHTHT